ncbi:hypothetical protein DYBT9275_04241 [Dyadobacter sp. CECT 9275]|uniref:Uncharacterized protein n=2 Tax=Dyadobacter helix TaxID=2822344 RepID=A0A916JG53_9BACT|nr:hypothetical protein DYBT9275_04241 [Dyadobacter sp. CECT 9275]
MDSFRKEIDQAFEQKLRKRFEDFQAPDKEGLSEKIFESIDKKPRRRRWLAASTMLLLLLLALPAGLMQKKARVAGRKETLAEPGKIKTLYSSKTRKETAEKRSSKILNKRNTSFDPNVSVAKTELSASTVSVADSSINSPFIRTNINADLLSVRGPYFRRFALPGITFEEASQTNEQKSSTKSSPFTPVFSVTGLQQFQLVQVHSDAEMPFQNVQFAPLLDMRSTGYKASIGFEKGSLRLLLNYGNLRNWSYYELGTKRIEISPATDGQYVQHRNGVPHVIDEKLHLLGLSAKTAIPLNRTPLRGFSTLAGLEFTTVLPDRSVMFWATISSVKSFHLGKKADLAIGPFAEYSLTQRSFLDGRWQTRPYRIGLTAEIKFPGK